MGCGASARFPSTTHVLLTGKDDLSLSSLARPLGSPPPYVVGFLDSEYIRIFPQRVRVIQWQALTCLQLTG